MSEVVIEFCHVEKDFGTVVPLKDVNAKIYRGDCVGIIGPSGCGKSTLLRCINLLDPPTGGEIYFDGEPINADGNNPSDIGKRIGMVFQRFNLFSHWTVAENIMKPQMILLGKTKQEAYDRAMALLDRIGLANKELAYPDELSGGQQQRIAIARTLALDPEVILFDEPTSALDPRNVGEVKRVIMDLAKTGVTMMIVSHDMRFVSTIANRVFYLDEGVIYEEGTPEEIFNNPQHEKTRSFIFRARTSVFEITEHNFDFPAMVAWVDEFGADFHLPYTSIHNIQLVVEETVMSILLPILPEKPHIRLTAVFDEETYAVSLIVQYNGKAVNALEVNALESDNELALKIVKSKVNSTLYTACEDENFANRLTMEGFFN